MTLRSPFTLIAAAVGGLALLLVADVEAQSTPVRVLVSNGMKGAMEELQAPAERAIGRKLDLQFSSTAALKKRIQAGEAFDATVITDEAIDDLMKQGRLAASPRTNLARSELGIGIRAGAPKPDIRTTEALKRTLLNAASVTYPQDGASRGFIEDMFAHMGIAADIKPRIILAPGSGPATESVAAGKAALVITLFSEIVPVQGVEILGALPSEFRYDIRFAGATSAGTKNAESARALIAFLGGPAAAPVYKLKGLIP